MGPFKGRGTLTKIDRTTTKDGKEMVTLVIHEEGRYPQDIPIKVFGKALEELDTGMVGGEVKVTFRVGGREWNGKYYADNVAVAVELVGQKRADEDVALPEGKSEPPVDDPDGLTF